MPKPYPLEFRRDVVAVARKHEAPLGQIAKDFGISESCLAYWLKKADVEDGVKPGVTEKESAELREANKPGRNSFAGIHCEAERGDGNCAQGRHRSHPHKGRGISIHGRQWRTWASPNNKRCAHHGSRFERTVPKTQRLRVVFKRRPNCATL